MEKQITNTTLRMIDPFPQIAEPRVGQLNQDNSATKLGFWRERRMRGEPLLLRKEVDENRGESDSQGGSSGPPVGVDIDSSQLPPPFEDPLQVKEGNHYLAAGLSGIAGACFIEGWLTWRAFPHLYTLGAFAIGMSIAVATAYVCHAIIAAATKDPNDLPKPELRNARRLVVPTGIAALVVLLVAVAARLIGGEAKMGLQPVFWTFLIGGTAILSIFSGCCTVVSFRLRYTRIYARIFKKNKDRGDDFNDSGA